MTVDRMQIVTAEAAMQTKAQILQQQQLVDGD